MRQKLRVLAAWLDPIRTQIPTISTKDSTRPSSIGLTVWEAGFQCRVDLVSKLTGLAFQVEGGDWLELM